MQLPDWSAGEWVLVLALTGLVCVLIGLLVTLSIA